MRQLHLYEPWSALGYDSQQEVLHDLVARIQILENRLRELEDIVTEPPEKEAVGVG
ncbi:MAG: hypothetical protein ACRDIF_03595 [Actinomycetota bacterium]